MSRLPRILIASSSEGLPYARKTRELLSSDVEAVLWNEGLFIPGEYPIESLELRSRQYDGALVVATADDRVFSRQKDEAAPRDNLLFEFGLFLSIFGRRRALMMVEDVGNTRLPSDLGGLTVIPFRRTDDELSVGLGPAVSRIIESASWLKSLPTVDQGIVKQLERVLRLAVTDVQEASGITSELGMHVFLVDRRSSPAELVRVARARSSPKSPRNWSPFLEEVGIVGSCWKKNDMVFVDFSTDNLMTVASEEWAQISPPERYGMSYEMLSASRLRYKCVGALPITEIGRDFLGCVSFNLGTNASTSPDQLFLPPVMRALDRCTEMVAIVLA